jgi:ribonuclease P protein component
MTAETGRFRRSDRLRESRDFKRVAARGDRFASNSFVMLVAPSGPGAISRLRLGVTASKRVGNAVVRNRVKRAIRGWFRVSTSELTKTDMSEDGLDVVVIARKEAAEMPPLAIADELGALVARRAKRLAQNAETGRA